MNKMDKAALLRPANHNSVCPQCGTGILHTEKKTFFKLFGNEVISVPDFPFWKCRICKWTEYDVEAIDQLIDLLGINFFKESGMSSIKMSFQRMNKDSWLFWHK